MGIDSTAGESAGARSELKDYAESVRVKLGLFWQYLGNSAVYYPKVAKVTGGVTASVFFCQLFQWQSQLNRPNQWVRVTVDEIENETGLSSIEQELARRQLIERSLIKERPVNGHRDIWEFWADIDALEERLNKCLEQADHEYSSKKISKNSLQEPRSSELNSATNQSNLYAEITTETPLDVVTRTQVERNNSVDSKRYSVSSDYRSSTETYCDVLDSSPQHTSVEVVDNTYPQSRSVKTDKFFPVRRQPIAVKVTPNYQFSGPWESSEQFEAFQRALLEHFKTQGVDNPSGWVFRVIDGMSKGLVSPFWDEFVAGIPLGGSQKVMRDWEIEPGVAYPAFEEERVQYYIHKGEPLEAAVSKARADLRNPVLGKDLWDGFLRKCDRMADDAAKAQKLGVTTPYLPPSFSSRPQVTKQSVIDKLSAVSSQFSLASSSPETPPDRSLKQQEIEEKDSNSVIPPISSLQSAYKTPMGRRLVEKQIAEHPEWGYGIVDGQVVDLYPF